MTDITIILDRSGSMSSHVVGTINGYNEFLDDQEEGDDDCVITLYQFNDEVEQVYEEFSPQQAPRLDRSTFIPEDLTALYDAIGHAVSQARARCAQANDDRDRIYVVITDGEENDSTEIDYDAVTNLVEDERKEGHEFVFLGAAEDVDAMEQAEDLGMSSQRALNYTGDDNTAKAAYSSTSELVGEMRDADKEMATMSYSAEDRAAAVNDDDESQVESARPIKKLQKELEDERQGDN